MAKLIIPTPLRKFTDNQASIDSTGLTVGDAIQELATSYPDLKKHLFEQDGKIRSFVRIYVGDDDIKALNNEATQVSEGSVISIIPAIAGGAI
ncbi:MAG: MoaD/ThiS family protein [Bacteroidota bacterium]